VDAFAPILLKNSDLLCSNVTDDFSMANAAGETRLCNESLDGYVDHHKFAPDPPLFRHFVERMCGLTGSVYGPCLYEVMRYWDEEHPEWDAAASDPLPC
jgi:hypothetical protein